MGAHTVLESRSRQSRSDRCGIDVTHHLADELHLSPARFETVDVLGLITASCKAREGELGEPRRAT
jgi:hypothetical protein